MKNLVIKIGEDSCQIPNDFQVSVSIFYRFGHYYISIVGVKGNTHYKWIDKQVNKGKVVKIGYRETETATLTQPLDNYVPFSDSTHLTEDEIKMMYSEELNKFKALEKLLRSENLIA